MAVYGGLCGGGDGCRRQRVEVEGAISNQKAGDVGRRRNPMVSRMRIQRGIVASAP